MLVFQTLSLAHPLLGDAVDEGEPELQERALAGDEAFPWVDHPEARRNPASRGLPRELVLTTPLRQLSHEALGPGLGTPLSRPSAARWAEALHDAAALTLECASCTGGFYLNRERCPFCDTPRAAFVLMKFRRWEPSRSQAPKRMGPHVAVCTLPLEKPQVLTARITEGDTGGAGQRPRVELTSDGKRLSVRCLGGARLPPGARVPPALPAAGPLRPRGGRALAGGCAPALWQAERECEGHRRLA